MQFVPRKLYYKIGEVCEIVGVPAHVLRYWETEFPGLAPPKSKGGQRTYRPKDIELLLEIKKLLYDERFTIAGARKKLGRRRVGTEEPPVESAQAQRVPAAAKPPERRPAKERLSEVREELENILTLLDRG